MWQFLALSFIFFGVFLVYCSNKNQGFIAKPLSNKWRKVGYAFWLLAFISWLQIYAFSAALFVWFFILSTILVCIPFMSLLIPPNKSNNKRASS